jgi:hypothetical protein
MEPTTPGTRPDPRQAARWLGVLAILFAVAGVLFYLALVARAAAPLEPGGGDPVQIREQLQRAPRVVLVTQLALAGVMTALWLWARRAPLAAVASAFAILALLQIASAIIEPASLTRGLLLKLVVVFILIKALRAAVAPSGAGLVPVSGRARR